MVHCNDPSALRGFLAIDDIRLYPWSRVLIFLRFPPFFFAVRFSGPATYDKLEKTMIMFKLQPRILWCTVLAFGVGLFSTITVFSQKENLGPVSYSAPVGFTKSSKENIIVFSKYDQASGRFCTITLYGATPGTGSPRTDFVREWKNLVAGPFNGEAEPKTETQSSDDWIVTAGGSAVEFNGVKALAFLTVLSGSGRTVSILGLFNDEAYLSDLAAFGSSLDIEKQKELPMTTAASPPQVQNGRLVIPPLTRQLTVAELAGEWGEDAQRISTIYVDRSSGVYAGSDSLSFKSKMTITRNGGYASDFFAIRNGQKIIDNTTGTVRINGRVFSITQKNTVKYVIRGWLELPNMTIWVVCGPWYDNDTIPEAIFSNPEQGANLNKTWVRKK